MVSQVETVKPTDQHEIGEWLLDFIFPRFCVGCQKEGNFLCLDCQSKIIKIKKDTCLKCKKITGEGICHNCKKQLPITKSIIFGYYRDPILKELIHQLKYEGLKGISNILSKLIIGKMKSYHLPADTVIIPVPLNFWRRQARGFNQSELISREIAKYFCLKIDNNLLIRTKNTKPQIGLTYKQRKENTLYAFKVNTNKSIPKTVVLIDDVVTTGSTVGECARALRKAGVNRIWVIALAHG